MNEIERSCVDPGLLRLFLAVLDEGSVTGAAARLDLTQSAVSHGLRRLAAIVGEPLFVKAGRGIAPTAHALGLRERAGDLLAALEGFGRRAGFRPAEAELDLVVAANDLQRDLLLPGLMRVLEQEARRVSMRIVPSEVPSADLLRQGRCDLLISPYAPEGLDIVGRPLLSDRYVCFYDREARPAPVTREDVLAARHVTVVYPNGERLDFDRHLQAAGVQRDFAVSVPSFSGVPAFLRGTDRLAILPGLLRANLMRDFAVTTAPLDAIAAARSFRLTMMMVWHRRTGSDPMHVWLRRQLARVAGARR